MTFHETYTLIATFVAIGVTLVGVIWTGILTRKSNEQTRESNELMEKDMDIRHRPWLVINDPSIASVKSDDKMYTLNEFTSMSKMECHDAKITKIGWTFQVTNTGLTPAKNIILKSMTSKKKITKKNLSELEITEKVLNLAPNQNSAFSAELIVNGNLPMPENITYALINYEYEFEDHDKNIQKSTVGKIIKFQVLNWRYLETWID